MLDSLQTHFRRHIQDNRKVGYHFAHRKGVDLSDGVVGYLAGYSLIHRGGIKKAVAKNDFPFLDRWVDNLSDQLGTACSEQQKLGLGENAFEESACISKCLISSPIGFLRFTGHYDLAMIDLLESIRQAAIGWIFHNPRTFEGNENAGFVTHDLGCLRFFEQSDNLVG